MRTRKRRNLSPSSWTWKRCNGDDLWLINRKILFVVPPLTVSLPRRARGITRKRWQNLSTSPPVSAVRPVRWRARSGTTSVMKSAATSGCTITPPIWPLNPGRSCASRKWSRTTNWNGWSVRMAACTALTQAAWRPAHRKAQSFSMPTVSSTSSPSSALAAATASLAARSTSRVLTRKTTASTNVRCASTAWP